MAFILNKMMKTIGKNEVFTDWQKDLLKQFISEQKRSSMFAWCSLKQDLTVLLYVSKLSLKLKFSELEIK
jgi:hypothetical protein